MPNDFTLFVDESGEAGISKIRKRDQGGASPYMVMGAVLVPKKSMDVLLCKVASVQSDLGKTGPLHCSGLKHYQILHFARSMIDADIRLFGIISKKSTLGQYKKAIGEDSKKYYNKCAQYLLERVGWYMETRGYEPHQLEIIFEKGNVDYKGLANLIRRCQDTPRNSAVRRLRAISADRISAMAKKEHPALWVADLVAHAIYKCVDKNAGNFDIPEPRYLRELAPRFFGDPKTNAVLGAGLHCVHTVRDVELDGDVESDVLALLAAASS